MLTKTKDTPYSRTGPTLVDNGFSAIPVLPGAKFPGARQHGQWVAETGWQRFCDRLPTEIETGIWSSWPDAGVCVVLGMNDVVAVDIDTVDPDITDAIMAVLPPPTVGKSGAKGKTYFYRASRAVTSRPYDIYRERVLDLLCHGRQTVIPPSVHPDTGYPYQWITEDTLADISPDALPLLPDDIADLLAGALEPFGYVHVPEFDYPKRGEEGAADTPWRKVNELARQNFDAWVPDLRLPSTKRNGKGTYRAAAVWRGGDGPNVSFHPKGIKDMVADRPLSALDVVMLATSSSLDAAFRWLAPKVGYKPPAVNYNLTAMLEAAAARRSRGDSELPEDDVVGGTSSAGDTGADPTPTGTDTALALIDADLPATRTAPAALVDGDTLDSLSYPGGIMQDLIDWIVASSPTPSRPLALSAVIPFMGALIGRRYSTGERDTRANVYTVGLADSGFGKEHARSQLKRLMQAAQGAFDSYSGPARIMSASALREVLEQSPCVNCMIDEFGGFVREITSKTAGSHQKAISTDLRDYYSASSTFFEGAAYRGTPAKKIENPMLCIYGTSTPDQFWNALSSASAEDGLLPRLLLFCVEGDKPRAVEAQIDVRKVPVELLQAVADVAGIDAVSKRLGDVLKRTQSPVGPAPKTKIVPWATEARDRFELLAGSVQDEEELVASEAKPFVRRILEAATKLALIASVSDNPDKPVVSYGNMDWAARLAWLCYMKMIEEVSERMADNLREANYKKISSLIKKAGPEGITKGRFFERLKGVDTRQREEIIKDLQVAGRVVEDAGGAGRGRPRARYRWIG